MSGDRPLIWIVDCEQWPRAALRAELIERGYDAEGHLSLNDALEKLRACLCSAPPHAIIIELRGQTIGADAYAELARLPMPLILLGGSGELSEPLIRILHPASVLKRPITLGEVADRVESIVPPPRS